MQFFLIHKHSRINIPPNGRTLHGFHVNHDCLIRTEFQRLRKDQLIEMKQNIFVNILSRVP